MKKLFKSFGYALNGMKIAFKEERNMKIYLYISLGVLIAGFISKLTAMEWIAIVLCIAVVLVAELFNTVIENIMDYLFPEHNLVAGKVKDISAAAVTICAIMSVIIGAIIFGNKLLDIIK
jgi:diacylglycerol kinase